MGYSSRGFDFRLERFKADLEDRPTEVYPLGRLLSLKEKCPSRDHLVGMLVFDKLGKPR